MTGAKISLLGAIGASVLPVGQMDPATLGLLDIFKAFGTTGLLLCGLVYVVREAKAQREKMERLAEAETAAKIDLAKSLTAMGNVLEDYHASIVKCHGAALRYEQGNDARENRRDDREQRRDDREDRRDVRQIEQEGKR